MKFVKKFQKEEDVEMRYNPNVVLVKEPRKILYDVTPPLGVYIQHINGNLYTTEEWTAKGFAKTSANGVAVIGSKARFVIAKGNVDTLPWSSDTENLVEGVGGGWSDVNGKQNTKLISASDTSGAVYACMNYTFPNGQKGYLPSMGECSTCMTYNEQINSAMTLIGGSQLTDSYDYWTSSQYSATKAYMVNFYGHSGYEIAKSSKHRVRPFTTL
jgi:hypothetical protein